MSSILDALKKLEAEKANAKTSVQEDLAANMAERELVGRNVLRERLTIRLTPLTLALGALGVTGLIVALSVGVSLVLVGPSAKAPVPPPVATAAPTTTPGAAPSAAPPETENGPPPAAPDPGESSPSTPRHEATGPDRAADARPPVTVAQGPSAKPLPRAAQPAKPPNAAVADAPSTRTDTMMDELQPRVPDQAPSPESARPPTAAPDPGVDTATLAQRPLRESDRRRLGLTKFQLNMLIPANESRPHASAIINLNKVYLGETIPRTNAKLVAVDGLEGVVIELQGSGERIYVRF